MDHQNQISHMCDMFHSLYGIAGVDHTPVMPWASAQTGRCAIASIGILCNATVVGDRETYVEK